MQGEKDVALSICPPSIETLRRRLSELVVEHEPEYLPQHVDRTISAFLAEIPPDEAASVQLALPELTRSISLACGAPGNRIAISHPPRAQPSAFEFDTAEAAAGDGRRLRAHAVGKAYA